MRTRVHDLALEYGVTSQTILRRLKENGWFIKSASSQVPDRAHSQLEAQVRRVTASGQDLDAWWETHNEVPAKPHHETPEERRRARNKPSAPLPNSWTGTEWEGPGEMAWREVGLGDDDRELAVYLLEHGVLPWDLKLLIRGSKAVTRFRSGEASRHVLLAELLEVRNAVEKAPRELPTKKVTRRFVEPPA